MTGGIRTSAEAKWLVLCGALAAGEAVGIACSRYGTLWPAAAAFAAFAALFGHAFRLRAWPAAAAASAGFALSLAASAARSEVVDAAYVSGGAPFETEVRVTGAPRRRCGAGDGDVVSFTARAGPLPVLVEAVLPQGAAEPAPGERWLCAGWLDRREPRAGAARRMWVRGRGTFARRLEDDAVARISAYSRRVRGSLSRRLGIGVDGGNEGPDVVRAMLLGERSRLPRDRREAFALSGTMHVFAVSGLHVMVVARIALVLASLAGVPFRFACAVVAPAVWAYAFVVGFPPSAVRAALMATLYCAAPAFWRRRNALAAWSAAFACVHLVSPYMLADVGCRLSFTVVLAIIAWSRVNSRGAGAAFSALGATAVAWAAGVPLAANAFGRVSPGGLLANVAALPAAGVCVVLGTAGCAASFASRALAAHANNMAALAARLMTGMSEFVSSFGWTSFDTGRWGRGACALWYAALAAALWLVRFRSRRREAV